MANVNGKLATLLAKFQIRLNKVSALASQNTDTTAALVDHVRLKVGRAEGIAVEANDKAERAHLSLIYLGEKIDKLTKETEDREVKQTLRDQNNVQALVNLRDSTAIAFDQVKADVESLLKAIQRLNERVGQTESSVNQVESNVNQKLSGVNTIDQSIVNSKLAGVYDVTADLESRLQVVEELATPPAYYLGYKVRFRANILIVDGQDFFSFQDNVAKLSSEPYGVLVTLKNGDIYLLCGGPTPTTMFVQFFKTRTVEVKSVIESVIEQSGWKFDGPVVKKA